VDYYSFSGTMNPYGHLSEVSGMSERSIRNVLASLVKKGLLRRKVSLHGNGRTNGVVFSIDPLVRKLKTTMKKSSPTVGEENFTYVYEESFTPNTGEDLNKKDESKNTSAKNADGRKRSRDDVRVNEEAEKVSEAVERNYGFIRETGGPDQEAPRNDRSGGKAGQIHLARAGQGPRGLFAGEDEEMIEGSEDTGRSSVSADSSQEIAAVASKALPRNDSKRGAGGYSPSRWYNEVFRGLYEEAVGQPALTGGREYKSAETYFRRLRELNPEMEPVEIYELAGEGAAFMMGSQMEGGVFGWMHKPPDICLLSSQAQSVEWHLRKMRRAELLSGNSGQVDKSPPSCPVLGASPLNQMLINSAASSEETTDSSLARNRPIKGEGINGEVTEESNASAGSARFIEKIREGHYASEQIERVYGELRGIESASRGRALPAGNRALRRKRG
jgi:hypothetical protein